MLKKLESLSAIASSGSYASFVLSMLSQPPACIHNSIVHAEPFTICQLSVHDFVLYTLL